MENGRLEENMTNFEAMKAEIIQTIDAMDEDELYEFIDNADMDMGWIKGVFNCSICENKYGDCVKFKGNSECKRRYKNWCSEKRKKQKLSIAL